MSIPVVRTNQESPKYSENLLTKKSTFKTGNWTTVITGGGGTIVAENDSAVLNNYEGNEGLLFTCADADGTVSSADDTMQITIQRTGSYILTPRIYVPSTYDDQPCTFGIYVYVNAVLYNIFEFEINNTEDFVFDEYNTYFQTLDLTALDVVNFQFKIGFQGETYIRFKVGGLKLELDDRDLGLPSRYTLPPDTVIESTQTIDIPSISSNDSYTLLATVTGAIAGDFVEVSCPMELTTLGLVIGQATATTNQVGIVIHNHSGGAINPASGTFKFKITR